MTEKIIITLLDANRLRILKEHFDEEGRKVGSNWRRLYMNSEQGREMVSNEIPSPQKEAVFAVWGGEPTVFDEEE